MHWMTQRLHKVTVTFINTPGIYVSVNYWINA